MERGGSNYVVRIAVVIVLIALVTTAAVGWGSEIRPKNDAVVGGEFLHPEGAIPVTIVVGSGQDREEEDREPRRVTIAGTGDVLIHGGIIRRAAHNAAGGHREYDFRPMFSEVRPIFDAVDLSICHLEVPISSDNTGLAGFPLFNAPRELADGLAWAGFDACSTASNHIMDQKMEGVISTHDQLDRAGVAHAGGNRTAEEAEMPRIYEAGDVLVGHVSATFSPGQFARPHPWVTDLLSDDRFEERARVAREAGADIVVVSLHWGYEYHVDPTPHQQELGRRLLEEGIADLILGHHAHVVQPITFVEGRALVYGLGNFISNQSAACCAPGAQDGMIAVIEMVEDGEGGWESEVFVIPTWVDRRDYTVVDVGRALRDPEWSRWRTQLEVSHRRTVETVGDEVVIIDGDDMDRFQTDEKRDPSELLLVER